jgi:hypothetical protein
MLCDERGVDELASSVSRYTSHLTARERVRRKGGEIQFPATISHMDTKDVSHKHRNRNFLQLSSVSDVENFLNEKVDI